MRFIKWLLDNPVLAIVIASVLTQLFKAIFRKKETEEPTAAETRRQVQSEDPTGSERARKVREEIQRRIAERQRAAGRPAAAPTLSPVEPPPLVREAEVHPTPPPLVVTTGRQSARRDAEILEQQAALADQLRQVQEMKAAAQRRVAFQAGIAGHATENRRAARASLLGELDDTKALRRAFLLREVLGPPVCLRSARDN